MGMASPIRDASPWHIEYIKQHLKKFVDWRYHDAFIRNVPGFQYMVDARYDIVTNQTTITVMSTRGNTVQLRVAAGIEFEVSDMSDWMCYQLQSMEPLMDTLVFLDWMQAHMSAEDERIFTEHLRGVIKRVAFIPPVVEHGMYHRTMYDTDGRGDKVTPAWLARVEFSNGACRREIIENVAHDTGTWVAMLLMAKKQGVTIGNA